MNNLHCTSKSALVITFSAFSLWSSACSASDSASQPGDNMGAAESSATEAFDPDAVDALAAGEAGQGAATPAAPCSAPELEQKLRDIIARVDAQMPTTPGYLLALRSDDGRIDVAVASPGIDPAASYRAASIGKTFTAAGVLRLVEQGRLDLDASVDRVAPAPLPELLRSGGYDPTRLTVRQLLLHEGGLRDYAESPEYFEAVLSDPGHHWTREEQVQLAMLDGQPLSEPGAEYHYSDTGYVLLGAIVEQATGSGLGPALRELLKLDELGLTSTWLESQEPAPSGVPAHAPQLLEGADLFSYDASIDAYGGGGYVSTARELVSFYRALLTGQVFDRPATLALMQAVPDVNVESHYAMGIEQVTADCWGHDGFWGTEAVYCPQQGLGLAVAGMSLESVVHLVGDLVVPVLREAAACSAAGVEP